MPRSSFISSLLPIWCAVAVTVLAQNPAAPPPATYTADQNHQNMMDQLHITALRPGPSGNEKAPNHANYDESKANPYSVIPDVLTFNNGNPVKSARDWKRRRGEISWRFGGRQLGRRTDARTGHRHQCRHDGRVGRAGRF